MGRKNPAEAGFSRRLRLPALASSLRGLVAVVGEVARVILLALRLSALGCDVALLLFVHTREAALGLTATFRMLVLLSHVVLSLLIIDGTIAVAWGKRTHDITFQGLVITLISAAVGRREFLSVVPILTRYWPREEQPECSSVFQLKP